MCKHLKWKPFEWIVIYSMSSRSTDQFVPVQCLYTTTEQLMSRTPSILAMRAEADSSAILFRRFRQFGRKGANLWADVSHRLLGVGSGKTVRYSSVIIHVHGNASVSSFLSYRRTGQKPSYSCLFVPAENGNNSVQKSENKRRQTILMRFRFSREFPSPKRDQFSAVSEQFFTTLSINSQCLVVVLQQLQELLGKRPQANKGDSSSLEWVERQRYEHFISSEVRRGKVRLELTRSSSCPLSYSNSPFRTVQHVNDVSSVGKMMMISIISQC